MRPSIDITAALEVATGTRNCSRADCAVGCQVASSGLPWDHHRLLGPRRIGRSSPERTDCRGVAVAYRATLLAGNPVGAFADIEGALANSDFSGEDLGRLIGLIVKLAFKLGGLDAFDYLVKSFVHTVEVAPAQRQSEIAVKTFLLLAKPDMCAYWPALVRKMQEEAAHGECRHTVAFLLPVGDVLEGKGQAVIESLPPQERAFALGSNQAIRVVQRGKPKSLVNSVSRAAPAETALPGRQ